MSGAGATRITLPVTKNLLPGGLQCFVLIAGSFQHRAFARRQTRSARFIASDSLIHPRMHCKRRKSVPRNSTQWAKPGRRPAPSISSSRQRGEKRLRFRDLG
jgi:hypothetical protein